MIHIAQFGVSVAICTGVWSNLYYSIKNYELRKMRHDMELARREKLQETRILKKEDQ